jgi:Family of unknown function (DUF5519)
MAVAGAQERIVAAVKSWREVEVRPHRYGGLEFRLGKRELGHIHGDALVDIPFPKAVRDEIVASGQAEPHHILPNSGWISLFLRRAGDVETAIRLLERSLQLALQHHQTAATKS